MMATGSLVAVFNSADASMEKIPEALYIKVNGLIDEEKVQSYSEGFVTCDIPLPRGFCDYPAELALMNKTVSFIHFRLLLSVDGTDGILLPRKHASSRIVPEPRNSGKYGILAGYVSPV